MCKSSACQHEKEAPIKDWKHRCQFGPDGKKLQSGTVIVGWNDMKTTHPALAAECLDNPTEYQAGTHKRLRWKCRVCPYEWSAKGNSRAGRNAGCGVCSKRILLKGWNDMATTHVELAKECMDDATGFMAGTNKRLRWNCSKCGGEWSQTGDLRTRGHGCWDCGQKQSAKTRTISAYEDSFAFHRPDLVPEYRGDQDPKTVFVSSGQIFNWQCAKCDRLYPAVVQNRTVCGTGCKKCSNKFAGKKIRESKKTAKYEDSFAFHRPDMIGFYCGLQDPNTVYAKSNQVFDWLCLSCKKEHSTTVCAKLRGSGFCNACKKCGFNPKNPSILYLVARSGVLKFGIASTKSYRLKTHKRNGWLVLDKAEVQGKKARTLEGVLKKSIRDKGVPFGKKAFLFKFDGYTESWPEEHFRVRSIRGLCRRLGVKLELYLSA
jgi:hypothetical protein